MGVAPPTNHVPTVPAGMSIITFLSEATLSNFSNQVARQTFVVMELNSAVPDVNPTAMPKPSAVQMHSPGMSYAHSMCAVLNLDL
jgi:hypothetical protein